MKINMILPRVIEVNVLQHSRSWNGRSELDDEAQ